eukprot:Skav205110  [mRNA]  locus=scaffold2918:245006:249760:- [translate_table: standard]
MVEGDLAIGWTIEPCQRDLVDDSLTDLVVKRVGVQGNHTIVQTQIHGDTYTTDVTLSNDEWSTLFRVKVKNSGQHLEKTWETFVATNSFDADEPLTKAVEFCAGIGAVATGYEQCGVTTAYYVEQNSKFAQWLRNRGKQVIEADVCSIDATMRLSNKGIQIANAGISCQPFSKLGDEREERDPRSKSLIGVLQAIHLLQIRVATLECTPSAMDSKWVQKCLEDFTKAKQMDLRQTILDISGIWPARRQRWWCTITHKDIAMPQLKTMPILAPDGSPFRPALINLMSRYMVLPQHELQQLRLDLYELRHFHSKPNIHKHLVDVTKPLPTATHSWGSQVKNCQCGCRNSGFSEARLESKGLYGQVLPIGGTEKNGSNEYLSCRHLHPAEVALINGLSPKYVGQGEQVNLRLELAGVGQLASPFQGAWIMSQIAEAIRASGGIHPSDSPHNVLYSMAMSLFQDRDELVKDQVKTRYTDLFFQAWQVFQPTATSDVQIPAAEDVPLPFQWGHHENETQDLTSVQPEVTQHPYPPDPWAAVLTQIMTKATQEPASEHPIAAEHEASHAHDHDHAPAMTAADHDVTHAHSHDHDRTAVRDSTSALDEPLQPPTAQGGLFASTTAPITEQPDVTTLEGNPSQEMDVALQSFQDPSEAGPPPKRHRGEEVETSAIEVRARPVEDNVVFLISPDGEIFNVPFAPETTVANLLHAYNTFHGTQHVAISTAMGTELDATSKLQQGWFLMLRDTQIMSTFIEPPTLTQDRRANLLWQQQGWVSMDEMHHYVQFIEHSYPSTMLNPVHIADRPDASTETTKVIVRAVKAAGEDVNTSIKAFLLLFQHHWVPVAIKHQEGTIQICTESTFASLLAQVLQHTLGDHDMHILGTEMARTFEADCGFQAISWILQMLKDEPVSQPFTPQQAGQWRAMAHLHMTYSGEAEAFVYHELEVGGMQTTKEDLQKLIVTHGVAPTRGHACADQLMQALGQSAIQAILRSAKPWADLKARANLVTPPIRIVQADELKEVIKSRLMENKPIGRKSNKRKEANIQSPAVPRADQLAIPPGVFCQADGVELSQLTQQQVGSNSKGVVLLDYHDAVPYFNLTEPVTQEGLALLVLNPAGQELPSRSTTMKVPAHCKATTEPVILTVAMVQMGVKEVQRKQPKEVIEVKQIANTVLRIMLYQDQYVNEWSQVVAGPVKEILHQSPLSQVLQNTEILDVWDRQYLTERLAKATPKDAFAFSVNIRVPDAVVPQLNKLNGLDGVYIEPRTADGRHPHPNFDVIWQPQKTFAEINVKQQVAKVPTTVVRLGTRYGLRTSKEHAAALRQELRPGQVFLQGSELKKYKAGPFPFGSTRASLASVFAQFNWPARALAPLGQTPDRAGVMWSIQASAPPSHWVWQLSHGDILIAVDGEPVPQAVPGAPVLASQRTMQTFQAQGSSASRGEDPWTKHDPWQRPSTKELSTGQMAALEASLEQKLVQKLKQDDVDMPAANDSRVTELESKMEQLHQALSTVQQEQAQHSHVMQSQIEASAQHSKQVQRQLEAQAGQIQQMEHKIDHHQRTTQAMIDTKMEEHFSRIEALFNDDRRTRTRTE